MSPHPLNYFAIYRYYQDEPKFNGVYSGNDLRKIIDEAHLINLDGCKSTGAHWIALFVNDNNVIYIDKSGFEYIPKEIKTFINKKNMIINIYYNNNTKMWGY